MLTTVDAPFLARKMADCLMAREGVLQKQWSYDYSVVHRGMEMLYARTGERKYSITSSVRWTRSCLPTAAKSEGTIWKAIIWIFCV